MYMYLHLFMGDIINDKNMVSSKGSEKTSIEDVQEGPQSQSTEHTNDTDKKRANKHITKTYLYNFHPLKPHFYIVKLGFTGVHLYITFLISAQKHRLWVLVRTASARRF